MITIWKWKKSSNPTRFLILKWNHRHLSSQHFVKSLRSDGFEVVLRNYVFKVINLCSSFGFLATKQICNSVFSTFPKTSAVKRGKIPRISIFLELFFRTVSIPWTKQTASQKIAEPFSSMLIRCFCSWPLLLGNYCMRNLARKVFFLSPGMYPKEQI